MLRLTCLIEDYSINYIWWKASETSSSSGRKEEVEMARTVSSEISLISRHKCDICRHEAYAIYILELDKWYCADCIQTVCKLLKNFT